MTTSLDRIEQHYDTSPRAAADAVAVGPFTVFLARPEARFPFYARPALDAGPVTRADVEAVAAYQDGAAVPRALEWVHETTPTLAAAARDAGFDVELCPLMALDEVVPVSLRADAGVEILSAGDARLAAVTQAVSAGYADREPGDDIPDVSAERLRISAGLVVVAGAFERARAVGGGYHLPRADATELVGIAVVPTQRRRGLGAALAETLAADARAHGATTVFLSAADDAVARVYERVGFRRVGTAGLASWPGGSA
jgi:ribosomal protein S18 acetylase RimI-like enzyme